MKGYPISLHKIQLHLNECQKIRSGLKIIYIILQFTFLVASLGFFVRNLRIIY